MREAEWLLSLYHFCKERIAWIVGGGMSTAMTTLSSLQEWLIWLPFWMKTFIITGSGIITFVVVSTVQIHLQKKKVKQALVAELNSIRELIIRDLDRDSRGSPSVELTHKIVNVLKNYRIDRPNFHGFNTYPMYVWLDFVTRLLSVIEDGTADEISGVLGEMEIPDNLRPDFGASRRRNVPPSEAERDEDSE